MITRRRQVCPALRLLQCVLCLAQTDCEAFAFFQDIGHITDLVVKRMGEL
jgi:hypothetical protein